MPLHFPHLLGHGHNHRDSKAETYSPPSSQQPPSHPHLLSSDSFSSTDSRSNLTCISSPSNLNDETSPSPSPQIRPQSILRRTTRESSTTSTHPTNGSISNLNASGGSNHTNSSSSASSHLGKRLSGLHIDRTDTIDSSWSVDERDHDGESVSTPGTSVSSLQGQCPLPESSAAQRFPFFMMGISSTSTLSFLALPIYMRPIVLDAIGRAWRKGVQKTGQVDYQPELMKRHKEKGCDGGVWEVTMRENCWMPKSEDKVASKRILINLMTEFAREGYNLTSSFRTTAKDSGKDTLIFLRGEPDPDPVFFAVAFHSNDRVWIIDAEADVGEALEHGIRMSWVDGIRDARVRERHCREIRLRGNPWTAHSTSSLISARCIHLVIMKSITHFSRGYDFVGSVDMADLEEGEMPVTFYRKKWAQSRAVWGEKEGYKELKYEPVSNKVW